ncbi:MULTISPECIES: hypothetical protein [Streptomyces]
MEYQDMPVRAYTTSQELHTAVDLALARRATAVAPAAARTLKVA